MKKALANLGIAFLFTVLSSITVAETVKLTSLEWPPYSGQDLPNQGASIAVAKAAFEAMGHTLEVDFFPWSRAVALAKSDDSYVGYFPEYLYESDDFLFSQPMGKGPLGFVEQTSNPIQWESLDDLKAYQIGVVQDYVNTAELDAMIASGEIDAPAVTSDSQNVLKVALGRVDVAVVDSNVLDFLLANDPRVSKVKGKVQMNDKLLVTKDLYIAFKNNSAGQRWKKIFDEGLTKIDVQAIMSSNM